MMPCAGHYHANQIDEYQFIEILSNAEAFESYIGYAATAEHIRVISGVTVVVSRDNASLKDGDVILVVRLKQRVQDTAKKRDPNFIPARDDYEYFIIEYRETK
jgi:hypothetical protein